MTDRPPFVHVTDEDVTETRLVDLEQRRAIKLLELGTPGSPLVRLSLRDWKYVDRVVAGLARMGVPAARDTEPNGDPAVSTETEHGMIPGSHERGGGAECRCGAEWSRWAGRCARQATR